MLADRGRPEDLARLATAGFVFDLKVDGIRCLASLEPGPLGDTARVELASRNDRSLVTRFPEIAAALMLLETPRLVLDAEIAVPGPDGLPSWPLTHHRTAQSVATHALVREHPAKLFVFDVLQVDDTSTVQWSFVRRREALEHLAASDTGWSPSLTLTPCDTDADAMWQLVLDHDLEGLVAKRPGSPYSAGRSRNWVKVKATQTVSCLVGGVDWAGEPAVSDPRSLHLFLVDDAGALQQVGKASAGVAAPLRRRLLSGILNPPLVVEVEYSQVSPGGVLRHPVLRAVRTDLDVLDCQLTQLRGFDAGS